MGINPRIKIETGETIQARAVDGKAVLFIGHRGVEPQCFHLTGDQAEHLRELLWNARIGARGQRDWALRKTLEELEDELDGRR